MEDSLFSTDVQQNFKETMVKSNFISVQKYLMEKEIYNFTTDYLQIPLFLYLNRPESEFFKKFFLDFI